MIPRRNRSSNREAALGPSAGSSNMRKFDWEGNTRHPSFVSSPVSHARPSRPVVIGAAQYPENIIETLGEEHRVYTVNATEEAKKIGNPRVFNLIVLGVAAQHMDFTKEQWYEVIEKTVPPKTIEINKKAFDVGYHL